jgi:hypothetical protein
MMAMAQNNMTRRINNEDEVFEVNRNPTGRKIENNFYQFLVSYELRPDDENYEQLAEQFLDM